MHVQAHAYVRCNRCVSPEVRQSSLCSTPVFFMLRIKFMVAAPLAPTGTSMARLWGIAAAAGFIVATPAFCQGAPKSAQLELARQAEKLKPGQWVWKPEIAPEGPILVYVDLTRQLA